MIGSKIVKFIFSIIVLFILCTPAFSFSGKTHKALTEKALQGSIVSNYLMNNLGMKQGFGSLLLLDQSSIPEPNRIPPDQFEERILSELPDNPCTILDFLKTGAHLEDVPLPRARHHFHAPIANPGVIPPNPNAGLDNKTDHPSLANVINTSTYIWYRLTFDLTGASALKRASGTEDPNWEIEYENYFAWPDTKDYFKKALTEPNLAARNHYLALTFLSLGQTVHLLEDMGVPAHTRNDFISGHYRNAIDNGNPFESWVEEQVEANGGQCPWLGTGPVVFDKLAKYFDADTYSGDYLGDGQWPPEDLWGLAECTNYQFLSLSTVFGCSGVKYQFPHPAKDNIPPSALIVYGKVGDTVFRKLYFNGSNYCVPHLARYSYTYYKKTIWGGDEAVVDSTNTTDDVNVFEDYADITIPRTIDYATGLANYFFRGRLNAEPNWVDPNIAILTITNDSNNSGAPQTLKGGTFELYWDDKDGNRAEVNDFSVDGWEPSSILDYNDTVTATFTQLTDAAVYTLVYKGDICENPDDLDTDDPNAIAIAVFRPGYAIITWGRDDYGQVTDAPDGNDFVAIAAGKRHCLALKSDGSLVAWGYNTHGECNVPDGTDFTAITAGIYHSIALKSDGSIVVWGDDSLWQITDKPSGNDFVAIATGDSHSLALKTNGTIVGWGGWNDFGECDAPASDPGTVYTAIAAGSYHSLALQSDGTIKAWGSNNLGQTRIYDGAGNDHEAVTACANCNLLLKEDDTLIAWGGGDWREPGIARDHHRQPDGTDFVAIAAGWDHILALTSDGEIFAWDWPFGDFSFDYFSRPVPPDVVFIEDIDAGYDFSVALRLP